MGLSESVGYIPNEIAYYSHLIGIMISKTIGFRGLAYFQTHPYGWAVASIDLVCAPVVKFAGLSDAETLESTDGLVWASIVHALHQRMAVLCCTVSIPGHDSLFCRNSIDVSVEGTAMEAKKTLDNLMDLL